MVTRFMFFVTLSLLLVSCGTRSDQAQQSDNSDIPVLTVANFDSMAGQYIGKEVQIEGLVDHVCRFTGKRMSLVRTDGEGRVKVVTGENIPSFDVALEGSDVIVKGIVDELKIDEPYLAEWEKELQDQQAMEGQEAEASEPAEHKEPEQGAHVGMGERVDQGTHTAEWNQIADYRNQIAASEKGYLSFFSIICSDCKLKQN